MPDQNFNKRKRFVLALLLTEVILLLSVALAAPAGGDKKENKAGQCHALLVSGMPGTRLHARRYAAWLREVHAYLTKEAGVPAKNVTVLSGDKESPPALSKELATTKSILKALDVFAAGTKPEDQFILFVVGHGMILQRPPALVLSGIDLDAAVLAGRLNAIPARNQVVLNFSASSGAFLSFLARKGRVNLTATVPVEGNEAIFAEFFLRGLVSKRADGEGAPAAEKKDGVITVLEAYNWAAHQTAQWFNRIRVFDPDDDDAPDDEAVIDERLIEWQVQGKESVEIFRKLYSGPEGAPGVRKLHSSSDEQAPDKKVSVKPSGGFIDEGWKGRLVLTEHSLLEDCGEEEGASALREDGYRPLTGVQEGEPGFLARRVVIGRAALLPMGDQ